MMNRVSESGAEPGTDYLFEDLGDLALDLKGDQQRIEHSVSVCLKEEKTPLLLGGDHSVTYPIVKAISAHYGPVNILHIDAHPDLYEDYEGNRLSHASPFARIMEEGFASRLVQVGIRTINAHQKLQAKKFGVEIIPMRGFSLDKIPTLTGPLYISIDLDGLDPAYAPGVSHHEPGGLSIRQLLDILAQVKTTVVGADIVEYNPDRDIHQMTAAVAAKLIKELSALIAEPREG